jgi:hypothetical protein
MSATSSRPFAFALAAFISAFCWTATLSVPQAQAADGNVLIVTAAATPELA